MRANRLLRGSLLAVIFAMALATAAPPAGAQEAPPEQIGLETPYIGIAVKPGDTVALPFDVSGPAGDAVDLVISSIPDGWNSRVRGGGFVVDRVSLQDGTRKNLKLEIDVPRDAAEGDYKVSLSANGPGSTSTLTIDFRVAESVTGGVSLDTEFPVLQGPSDVTFNFTLQLSNNTGEDQQFELRTEGPSGWQINARPSGQSRASTVTVAAGGTERVTVEADPPDFTDAGIYPITVSAVGGGETVSSDLSVEVTGNFDMSLVTADQRLNVTVQSGSVRELPLVVVNNGSATLSDVKLSATAPRGWEASFEPESISVIEPGSTVDVTATIQPSSDAITGDYRITVRAAVAETSDQIELRATVETSTVWGVVGIGVIVLALGALGIVFRRFGRR